MQKRTLPLYAFLLIYSVIRYLPHIWIAERLASLPAGNNGKRLHRQPRPWCLSSCHATNPLAFSGLQRVTVFIVKSDLSHCKASRFVRQKVTFVFFTVVRFLRLGGYTVYSFYYGYIGYSGYHRLTVQPPNRKNRPSLYPYIPCHGAWDKLRVESMTLVRDIAVGEGETAEEILV